MDTEKCIAAGVAQASCGDHVDSATYAAALQCHDDRDAQVFNAGKSRLQTGQHIGDGGTAFGALVIHVHRCAKHVKRHARTEMFARAAHHQHPCLVALMELLQHLIEFTPKNHVQGIECIGAIQHQMRNMVLDSQFKTGQLVHDGAR